MSHPPKRPPPGLICQYIGPFPLTKDRANHVFRGFRLNQAAPLPADLREDQGVITSILQQPHHAKRKILGDRLFHGHPTHYVSFEAHILTPPHRTTSLLKLPLSLDEPGRDGSSLLWGMVKFCIFQAGELRKEVLILNDGPLQIYEESLLLSSGPHTKIYWATSLLLKFEDLLKNTQIMK